ncbi:hypothetical protein J6590_035072 [Homalodisca vitripennis]|nr:hypothetical protein J6590_035072 [Homalodisca vitripennis]
MSGSYPKELLLFCRSLGVFPVHNVSAESGRQRFSIVVFLYSLALVSVQSCLCLYSLRWELDRYRSIYPKNVQTSTAQVVKISHICSLTMTAIVCVITSGNSGRLTQLYKDLDQVDNTLARRCQSHILTWMCLALACLTVLFTLEYMARSVDLDQVDNTLARRCQSHILTWMCLALACLTVLFTLEYMARSVDLDQVDNTLARRCQSHILTWMCLALACLTVLFTLEYMARSVDLDQVDNTLARRCQSHILTWMCLALACLTVLFTLEYMARSVDLDQVDNTLARRCQSHILTWMCLALACLTVLFTLEYMARSVDLDQVDNTLARRCQSHILTWMCLTLACLTVLYTLEYLSRSVISPMNAVYLAVYSMQYTALAVQLQYVSVVDGIRRRLQLVNDRIFEEVNRRRFRGLLKLGHLPPVDLPGKYS